MSEISLLLNHRLKTLYCVEEIKDTKVAESFISFFSAKNLPVLFIRHENEIPENLDPKEHLVLTSKRGGFVNPCPCTPNVIRCGYSNINLIEGCPFICNYCALDVYLKNRATRIFTNLKEFEHELELYLQNNPHVRIGTGELTDSLVFDEIFPYSAYLTNLFRNYPDSILEFKTKSNKIDRFLSGEVPVLPNILLSWSVNTPRKISEEEQLTTNLEERISAAKKVSAKGFKVGFHFDPIYYYEGFEQEYRDTIHRIFSEISPSSIGWISLGVIRFNLELKDFLLRRNSKIMEMELFPSYYDGKMRLFYQARKKVFSFFANEIKQFSNKIYLCMEPAGMWEDAGLSCERINERIFQDFFK